MRYPAYSILKSLTGVTSESEVGAAGSPVPDFVVQSIGDLVQK